MAKTPLKDYIATVERKKHKAEDLPIKGSDDNEIEKLATRIAKRRGWKDVEKIKVKVKNP